MCAEQVGQILVILLLLLISEACSPVKLPPCQCLPCNDSAHTSLPIPGRPEDSSSCSTLILGSTAVGVGVIALLICTVFGTVFHEREQ